MRRPPGTVRSPAAPAGGTRPAPGTPRHPRPAPVRADRLSPSWSPSFRTTSCLRPVYTPPGTRTGRLASAQFPGAAVYALPTARTIRPPDRAPAAGNDRGRFDDGIVRIGRARGVRRSRSPPPGAVMNVRVSGRHGKAANGRKQVSRTLARVFAGWRTGLPGPVIVLQAGTAVNYFGTGLILPFEIIYLHQARGFPTATAGLVLAVVMGTAAVVTPLSGALLDRFRAKPLLITGNLASAARLRGLRVRRPSLAGLRLRGRRRRRVRRREHREPGSGPDPGLSGAARLLDRAAPGRSQLRSRHRRDGRGLHRRCRQ